MSNKEVIAYCEFEGEKYQIRVSGPGCGYKLIEGTNLVKLWENKEGNNRTLFVTWDHVRYLEMNDS